MVRENQEIPWERYAATLQIVLTQNELGDRLLILPLPANRN
jgi:hypothetical protein